MTESLGRARRAVVLFTKPAVPGRVKTRLVGDLSAEEAARLHAAFVRDTSATLSRGDFTLQVAWALDDGSEPEPDLVPAGLDFLVQEGDDLGQRLHAALSRVAGSGFGAVGAVGSDHPGLPATRLTEAFDRLEAGLDVVWGPVPDGGYDLVAVRSSVLCPELFEGIAWSTEAVLEQSLTIARSLGLRTGVLEPGFDVDTPDDLDELVARLRDGGLRKDCPSTCQALEQLGRLERREVLQ